MRTIESYTDSVSLSTLYLGAVAKQFATAPYAVLVIRNETMLCFLNDGFPAEKRCLPWGKSLYNKCCIPNVF
jgi:hypothetical protein